MPHHRLHARSGLTVPADAIAIEDLLNGMYKISYAVPSAGEWTMTLSIDENAYDVSARPIHLARSHRSTTALMFVAHRCVRAE